MNSINFKYDIAISLCNQDIDFARKLVEQLNPGLSVFFYENNQHELISKSGPEAFAKVFKKESRIVIILSRNEWSESYYTEIERNAIIDRTSVKNEGYNFLFVIPMEPNQAPVWYPPTRIYADPRNFTIEELAKFIEFKVVELDGILKQITVEEKLQLYQNKVDQKRAIIDLQRSAEAIEEGKKQIEIIKNLFNEKAELLKKSNFNSASSKLFQKFSYLAYFEINDFRLICEIFNIEQRYRQIVVTTQDIGIQFKLSKIFNSENEKPIIESPPLKFYYSNQQIGWSTPYLYEKASYSETLVLYRNSYNTEMYDLKNPISSESIIDYWFQLLLENAIQNISRYL